MLPLSGSLSKQVDGDPLTFLLSRQTGWRNEVATVRGKGKNKSRTLVGASRRTDCRAWRSRSTVQAERVRMQIATTMSVSSTVRHEQTRHLP